MVALTNPSSIEFSDVVRKHPYKWSLILALALIAAGIAGAMGLYATAPKNCERATNNTTFALVVPESAEPPLKLTLSHTFPLRFSGHYFEVADGPDSIDYVIKITGKSGSERFNESGSLFVPWLIKIPEDRTDYASTKNYECRLSSSKYTVTIQSTYPVDYKLEQTFRYSAIALALILLGVLGAIVFAGVVLAALKKRDALKREMVLAAYLTSHYPCDGTSGYSSPPHATYATPDDAGRGLSPSLTYVQGETEVDYICGKCGNYIQNPPVAGVITCERCGEKEYVQ